MKKYTLQKKINKTFSLVFICIFLLMSILMAAIIGKVYENKYYQLCDQLVSLNLNLLNNQVSQVQRTQEILASNGVITNAVRLFQASGERDYGAELERWRNMDEVFYTLAQKSGISNAYIVDPEGNYLYFYKKSLKKDYNMLQEDWYRKLAETVYMNTCYVSELHSRNYLVADTEEDCISMMVPIQKNAGYIFKPDAFLVCDIDLNAILSGGSDEEDMQFVLLDDASIIYHSDSLVIDDREKEMLLAAARDNERQVWVYRKDFFTKDVMVTMKSKLFGWKMIGIRELKEIRTLNTLLLLILSGTILITVFLIIFLSKRVARTILLPMNRLIERCNRIGAGDYSVSFEECRSLEIATLSNTVETMVNNVVRLSGQMAEEEKKLAEEQLKLLQYQINPHFLNNVLQTIKALAVEKETEKISRISTLLGRILSYAVYQPHQSVPLNVELAYLKDYIELQNIRYDGKIFYSIDCDDDMETILIPKLTLQPLVENSIEHGYEGRGRLVLSINAEANPDMLCIVITDNGRGMTAVELSVLQKRMEQSDTDSQECSIGIVNVNERLKRMYGKCHGVQLVSKFPGGTTAVVRLPRKKQ